MPSEREKAESNRLQNVSGLVNKGNTCYANAILHSLNAVSKFCHVLSSISNGNNKLSNALLKIFYKLRTSKTVVDPSAFLKSLSDVIKSGNTHFEISSQQDAPEVLLHLLGECASISPTISNLFEVESHEMDTVAYIVVLNVTS